MTQAADTGAVSSSSVDAARQRWAADAQPFQVMVASGLTLARHLSVHCSPGLFRSSGLALAALVAFPGIWGSFSMQ